MRHLFMRNDQKSQKSTTSFHSSGQGRLDGSFCDYSKEDQLRFFNKLQSLGVCNIEMESAAVLAMAHKVGVKGESHRPCYKIKTWPTGLRPILPKKEKMGEHLSK